MTMFSGIVAHRPAAGNVAFAAVGAAVEAMARTIRVNPRSFPGS